MTIRLRSTEKECRETARRPAETAEADRAQDTRSALAPVAVTWARAQLRERIQQAGAALAPAAEPAHSPTREPDHSPLADREPEP